MRGNSPSDRPVRVGIFCDSRNRGGVSTYTCRLAQAVRPRGVRVIIFTLQPKSEAARAVFAELAASADDICVLASDTRPAAFAADLDRALRHCAIQVFVPNYRRLTYGACAAASRTSDVAVLGVCHNDDPSYYDLLRDYHDLIHSFICPSRKTFDLLANCLPTRRPDLRLIPHGIPVPAELPAGYTGGPIRLLYHGRLEEEQKNVSAQFAVAQSLRDRGIPFLLRLAGTGSCAGRYREMTAAAGLQDHIQFVGDCSEAELQELFRSSHVAVLSSRYEGFCLSLAEAMGAGLPAVAFRCGGVIEEYLRDGVNGFVVPFGDVEALAERIRWFVENPARWQEMSAAARATIQGCYSLELFGERYACLFREVAAVNRRRQWPRFRPVHISPGGSTVLSILSRIRRIVGARG
jgi:glycosyltransferase involved in cell wall biosynthesis